MPRFQVTFDCKDPDALARFWAAAIGYEIQSPPEGFDSWEHWLRDHGMEERIGSASAIVDPEGTSPRFFFQRVPEAKTAKNRVHLDLNVSTDPRPSPSARKERVVHEVERLINLGATKVRVHDDGRESWTVMIDPEGNEFCVQ